MSLPQLSALVLYSIFFQDSHIGEILINENVIIFFWNKALELTAEAETLMLTLAF